MFHPLIRLLATRPDLLADHLGGYAALVGAQASQAQTALRSRTLLLAVLAVTAALGLGLCGVALLLLAVVPLDNMPMPWLLAAAPALPLLAALGCWWALKQRPQAWSMDALRAQWAADAALLRDAGTAP